MAHPRIVFPTNQRSCTSCTTTVAPVDHAASRVFDQTFSQKVCDQTFFEKVCGKHLIFMGILTYYT